MMKFSQRKGLTPTSHVIQRDGMSEALRASLWNILDAYVWQERNFLWRATEGESGIDGLTFMMWFEYLKAPIDTRPDDPREKLGYIRDLFFKSEWFEVYDLLEWLLNHLERPELIGAINKVLERELAGFRFIGDTFTDITDPQEVEVLQEALADDRFTGVRTHLQTALALLSRRDDPDYRNSIKESICAIESLAKVLTGKPKATLGEALASLEKSKRLHPALKEGFSKLYGYTSDEGGIRHAMLDEPSLTAADAKFFLLSSTSFIQYLKSSV